MRHPITFLLSGSLALSLSLMLSGCTSKPVQAELGKDGVQTVRIVAKGGYQPAHVEAQAGKPLRVEFYRDEDAGGHSCVEEVVIPSENVKITLPSREPQIVEIKPQPAGEMAFKCGMDMVHGKITFKE